MNDWVRACCALVLVLSSGVGAAQVWSGHVIGVMDGDTVLLVREGQRQAIKLRIDGIDAPEICQTGGAQAREAMVRLALRQAVQVDDRGVDSYGRSVGRILVDGVDLGAEMVRTGMAWAYRFRTGKGPYAGLQGQAKKHKLGVFADPAGAMPPPEFRKLHGACPVG